MSSVGRTSGVLLPVSALPGKRERGDFDSAYRFIDFLAAAGVGVWQVLPLGPTHSDNSPYLSLSAHAGNPSYVGIELLHAEGLLSSSGDVEAATEAQFRRACLREAYDEFCSSNECEIHKAYEHFQEKSDYWLTDFAVFSAIRAHQNNSPWTEWSIPLRDKDAETLTRITAKLADEIELEKFIQFLFFRQWRAITEYARGKGIKLFGDMPLFVSHDSADVWAYREYFLLDERGAALFVAGVPPDYFSEFGQRWGNPLYNWKMLERDEFRWWIDRLRTQRELYDLIRIDHFRGLQAYWEIPADAPTAQAGVWKEAPGQALLSSAINALDDLELVAEDLGTITFEVTALRDQFDLPGMKVLHFAFESDEYNPHLPENTGENNVIYTGTHDNDTSLSWYQLLPLDKQQRVDGYLHRFAGQLNVDEEMPWPLIECALASRAQLAVIPMQDLLGLGEGHRTNVPGTVEGNWSWHFKWEQVPAQLVSRIRGLNERYRRLPQATADG